MSTSTVDDLIDNAGSGETEQPSGSHRVRQKQIGGADMANIETSINESWQAVTLAKFPDGTVAEVVTYIHGNELQVTIDPPRTHRVTVTVDDKDVYSAH